MSNNDLKVRRFVNLMAFVALILTATALIVGKVLQLIDVSAGIVSTIAQIGSLIASIVLVFVAYFYVKTKRKNSLDCGLCHCSNRSCSFTNSKLVLKYKIS